MAEFSTLLLAKILTQFMVQTCQCAVSSISLDIANPCFIDVHVLANTRPFMVTFFSDATEVGPAGAGASNTHEESVSPGGIIGFNLRFEQRAC